MAPLIGAVSRHRQTKPTTPWSIGWLPIGRWLARRRQSRMLGSVRPSLSTLVIPWAQRHTRWLTALVAAIAGLGFLLVAGPVAAVCTAAYSALAVSAGLRTSRVRREDRLLIVALDAIVGLAADLRSGMPPGQAVAVAAPALGLTGSAHVRRLARLVHSACVVAETTGAPLADLLDRIDQDTRSAARARALAAAHAAGITATVWLLAVLPGAGIAVGYGMGTDPLRVLLHTPIGAVCAGGALLCQLAGLAWASRLARSIRTWQ